MGEQDQSSLEKEETRDHMEIDASSTASSQAVSKAGRTSRSIVQIKEPPVSEMRDYVPYEEGKRGPLQRAIPIMPLSLAVTCCVFNIVVPGFGKRMTSRYQNHS